MIIRHFFHAVLITQIALDIYGPTALKCDIRRFERPLRGKKISITLQFGFLNAI